MSALKTFLKSRRAQSVAAFLLSLYIRLVYATSRKVRHIDKDALPYMQGDESGIFAFWHGRMMMMPLFCPPRRKMRVLISRHRDGLLISQVISHFGQATVSGSSSKGGKEAASEILRALEAGDNVSITPDGPRGPSQVAAKGVASLARMAKKPVLPVTFASTREKRLKSWDRFALALPFGRIVFCVGAPMVLSETAAGEDEETVCKQVEQTMNRLAEQAEALAHG